MRLFLAVDVDKKLVDKIEGIKSEIMHLDVDVKFVERENLHFTLKFLGEMEENEVENIKQKLREVIKDFKKFKIGVQGLSYFGGPSYIRTIWLDVHEGKDYFVKLTKRVNECLGGKANSSPHLTIGRVKSGKNRDILLKKICELKNVNVGEMVVNEIKLKKSVLTQKGPVYSDVILFKLPEGNHE